MSDQTKVLKVEMGFDPDAAAQLEQMKKDSQTESTEQLIVNALRVYGWYLENKDGLCVKRGEQLVKVDLQL